MKDESIGNRRFLTYALAPDETLDPVILGMMENNPIRGLLPVTFLQKDEQQILRYDRSDMAELTEAGDRMRDGMELLPFLKDLADILLEAEEYMIGEAFFEFGMQSVFIGKDGKGRLVCLPVEGRKGMAFQQFCSLLLSQLPAAGSLGPGILARVNAYLSDEKFSKKTFSLLLDKLELRSAISVPASVLPKQTEPIVFGKKERVSGQKSVPQKTGSQPVILSRRKGTGAAKVPQTDEKEPAGDASGLRPDRKKVRGYLYRKSSKERIEIDREEFRIGKGREHTDYRIRDNSYVSRQHAKIFRQGEAFYIMDLHSLNHTYVDKKKLEDGQPVVLPNKTLIKLANEEFIFLTEEDGK